MKRLIAGVFILISFASTGRANAQETSPGPGVVEMTAIPAGGTWFTSKNQSPEFGNYGVGGAVAYNFNRLVGAEGEVAGSFGIKQSLSPFGGTTGEEKPPNMLTYTGNVVVNAAGGHSLVPYATGGIGGLTLYDRAALGIFSSDTFFTGNVGGGVKWFAPGGRWGIRGDYRFQIVRSKDDAPEFFGQDTRYGHRVYGAVIINAIRGSSSSRIAWRRVLALRSCRFDSSRRGSSVMPPDAPPTGPEPPFHRTRTFGTNDIRAATRISMTCEPVAIRSPADNGAVMDPSNKEQFRFTIARRIVRHTRKEEGCKASHRSAWVARLRKRTLGSHFIARVHAVLRNA